MRHVRSLAGLTGVLVVLGAIWAGPAAARSEVDDPPPAPTDLVLVGTGGSALLSWQQPPGERARSFRVYEGTTEVARNTTTSVALTNLGFARTRTYTVTAVDTEGRESAPSTPVSRTLGISGAPPQCLPAGLATLSASQVTPSAVTLSWVNVGDPGTVTVTGGPDGPVSTGSSGIRIGGLAPATTYTFSVVRRPHCSGSPSFPATTVTVTTAPGRSGTPTAPVDATVAGRTDRTLTLSWTPPVAGTPATRYAIYESGRRVATTSGTSATLRGLYHAAWYTYQVTALDARGNESPAGTVAGYTATCQARPPRPALVTAVALSASSVRLDWTYDAAAMSYTVYAGDEVVGTSVGSGTVVSGLASATSYRLRVAATLPNGCGASPTSAAAWVDTAAGPASRPARPTDVRLASGDPFTGTMTLHWTQPADGDPAVAYRVYRGADVIATNGTNQVAIALPKATTQVVTIAAVNAAGLESAQSAPLTVQVPYLPPP
ncbi:hypothetical protein GCM10027290_44670 [Micromonospora sonneratiae]|uniref:Fibronectin type III domain-containing protein n=1 Tax=Micromonospora sonneratiae TaxID=1184706 RepID=A0ABW3Y814_9ACTN